MKKFKDLISEKAFNKEMEFTSVSVSHQSHTLHLRFDSKDVLVNAAFSGPYNPWLSSLCYLMQGKSLNEISSFTWETWKKEFQDDQTFWDLFQEEENHFIHLPLELTRAALDVYRGKDYLYQESSPLVCRCFGIRESDILSHLQKNETPTLDTLAGESKAGMGCRSCVPQLKRWLVLNESKSQIHYYKNRPAAEWLLDIDEALTRFPHSREWKLEVRSFKAPQVIVSFEKDVSQREEENLTKELQLFLGREVDPDLGFFLRRARHFSKARG